MTYFSRSDSGNGSVLAITWDGGTRFERLMGGFSKNRPQAILLDPLISEMLGASTEQNTQRFAVIPASEAGETELVRYSLPGLSSLNPASSALKLLFPGLYETDRKTVHLIAPKDLAAIATELPEPLRLMIDTPGVELDIFKALEQSDLLKRVDAIHLRCGIDALFVQASESHEILSWLEERFFRIFHKNEDDADWPEFLLLRDPLAERVGELSTELKGSAEERDKAVATAQANAKRAEELIAELRATTEERDKAVATTQADLTNHEEKLKDSQNSVKALRDEILRLRETLTVAEERNARADADRDQARKDLGIALRNTTIREQDYNDLRDRHAHLLNEKNNLEQLIHQLTPRLQEAAEHLRHFSDPLEEKAELKRPARAKTIRQKPAKPASGT